MNRTEILALRAQHEPEMPQRFDVTRLALFGSHAREEAHANSDIDVLVGFDGPATSARYFGVQFFLEDLCSACPVDLVTEKALRAALRPFVERDAVHVWQAAGWRVAFKKLVQFSDSPEPLLDAWRLRVDGDCAQRISERQKTIKTVAVYTD